ncbi:D-alanyl-D-alanine carboxypeptidase family protein [Proteinivorax hydrogeniformans]|uniref:D-alanyl-D-alanine carboxypeptidase family protein n=1 Tax=Proteinivorax hydrogeniformans TaxID=1826727 RepID=A0AAU8HX65_9FIRM
MLTLEKSYKNFAGIALAIAFIIILFFANSYLNSDNLPSGYALLTVEIGEVEGGKVSGGGQYKEGKNVTVKAQPKEGYKFVGWQKNDETISTQKIYDVNLKQSKTITAIFQEAATLTIKKGKIPGGTVEGSGQYKKGENVSAIAKPTTGYEFVGWEKNNTVISTDKEIELTLENDKKITAIFKLVDSPVENNLVIADGDYLKALVTKDTYLGRYHPADLKQIPVEYTHDGMHLELREETLEHLIVLLNVAKREGINELVARSGYRTFDFQKRIFANQVSRHGSEEQANIVSARPGQSEHQLGTAVDFSDSSGVLSESFANTSEGKWLAENAHKYGFIMSYPEDKKHITGYIYEPWHFRYVGIETAQKFKQSGHKTLTEFLKEQKQYFEKIDTN